MTRMRMPLEQSFTEAQELVEDLRKNRDTSPTGAVSFVNYYANSFFYYQTTTLSNTYYNSTTFVGGVESFNGRDGVVTPQTNDYLWSQISLIDDTAQDASTTKHGLMKKLPNNGTLFFSGTGGFQTVPAGAAGIEVLIATAVMTGTAVAFSGIASGYKRFRLVLEGRASGNDFAIQFNDDTTAGNYRYQRIYAANGSVIADWGVASITSINIGAVAAEDSVYHVLIENFPGVEHMLVHSGGRTTTSEMFWLAGSGYWNASNTEISKINMLMLANSWTKGTAYLYGYTS